MSPGVISVTVDTEVDKVCHLLVKHRIHRVPVLDRARLARIVSRSPVVALLATEWVCQVFGEAVRDRNASPSCPTCHAASEQFVLQDADPSS